jgi:tetratricopeptide (TPR) repeat protein
VKHVALVVVFAAGIANADVWQHALDGSRPDLRNDGYEFKMRAGDQFALQANSQGISFEVAKRNLKQALAAYRDASAIKPNAGEPYYRTAQVLYSLGLDCTRDLILGTLPTLCQQRSFDPDLGKQFVAALDAFEARAPLDPRLSCIEPGNETCLRFERAIVNTKLGNLEAASKDYETIVRRAQPDEHGIEVVMSNLAETYMMLNRLDESIDMYREALHRYGGDASTVYGYAVALDRDERGTQARDEILGVGLESYEAPQFGFKARVASGAAFFVPHGEVEYYFGLIEESLGRTDEAIGHWRRYISSGAHPQFQPRAKQHLDALLAKQKNHPPTPPPVYDDLLIVP